MQSLTSTPNRPKHPLSSALPSARRASTGTVPTASTSSLPIKTHSRPSTSTSTGIPAFRSLRSLLPFGPSKHATPASPAVPSTPSGSKNPFYSFGSVRRSMQREGKASQDVQLPPVISIDKVTKDELEGSAVRRSVSCSMLQPIDGIQEGSSNPFQNEDDIGVISTHEAPILRTPSPGPPISAELSTILEADSSGISKYIPSSKSPSRAPSPDIPAPVHEQSHVIDTSVLDLSTTHLEDEVLGAMRSETSSKPQGWNVADQAIIIDADAEDPDSLNLNALDPDLAAILTPHRPPTQRANANVKKLIINSPQMSLGQPVNNFSNSPPQFVLAPSPIISGDPNLSSLSPLHSRLPRQQSSLPRLRSPISPSHHTPHSPTPSTVAPSSSASDLTFRGEDARKTNPPPPFTVFSPTFAPPSPFTPPKTISSPLSIPTASMTPFLSRCSSATKAPSSVLTLASSQPVSSSRTSRVRTPFTQMPRPGTQRPASSPEANTPDVIRPFTPLSTSRPASRPSIDSTFREGGPFDLPRRSLSSDTHRFEHTSSARPSLDTFRGTPTATATDTENARFASAVLERARKRSLSVQDRLGGRHTLGVSRPQCPVGEADRQGDLEGVTEFGMQRSSSSQSMRVGRRWGGGRKESMTNGSAPVTEWLGPRTVKAFKAAGLLDFERDQQPHSDRNGPGSLNSNGRLGSIRSPSEYNARAPSRLAVSEAGGSSTSRRGSVSGTPGLMESPTFTVSSGSRDTPRSASTAPTSVSGSTLFGRDRDREREDIRELKDKHAGETEALLAALSDSQRTAKMLREENGDLRARLEQAEAEVNAFRKVVGELTKETGDLRVQIQMLKSNTNNRLGATIQKSGFAAHIHIEHDDHDDNKWSGPVGCKVRDKLDVEPDFHQSRNGNARIPDEVDHHSDSPGAQAGSVVLSSTPGAFKHQRRFSTTSSVFPVPPPNMTLLLHDQYDQDTEFLHGSLDHSQFSTSVPPPRTHDDTVTPNVSLTSAMSMSPSIANFSMTTESPGSLFLRPEHELHLGDMDSLDLGVIHNADAVSQDAH